MAQKLVLALFTATCAFAQSSAPLTFEVATIKTAQPPTPQAMMAGKIKIGETLDAGRAEYGFVNMEYLLTKAYKVKSYQISGPAWIQSERYDISAKLPPGATKEQVPDMLKALLVERFQITLHHETKEHSVYALVVGKNGLKIKESAPEKPDPADADKPAVTGTQMSANGDGRGMTMRTPQGNMKMTMSGDGPQNGSMRMEGSQMPIDSLIEFISRMVDKPVVDQTNLKGKYDMTIELSMADMMSMARSAGMAGPMGGGGGRGGGATGAPADSASDPSGGSIFQTVQNMGLKLEPKKAPLDMIVVDKGEKTPTEN